MGGSPVSSTVMVTVASLRLSSMKCEGPYMHVGCDRGTENVWLASSVMYTDRDYRRAGHRAEVETLVPSDDTAAASGEW